MGAARAFTSWRGLSRWELQINVTLTPQTYHILHAGFCSAGAVGRRRDAAAGCCKAPTAASRACCHQAQSCPVAAVLSSLRV